MPTTARLAATQLRSMRLRQVAAALRPADRRSSDRGENVRGGASRAFPHRVPPPVADAYQMVRYRSRTEHGSGFSHRSVAASRDLFNHPLFIRALMSIPR